MSLFFMGSCFGLDSPSLEIYKIQNERAAIYNALNLTDEQIKIYEGIISKNARTYEEKLTQLNKENFKIKVLEKSNADKSEIECQKKIVKSIQKGINNLQKEETKEFKKCLTHDQRSKYAMIKKLERKARKDSLHQKNYYKSNPQMRPFGNPVTCPCSNQNNK